MTYSSLNYQDMENVTKKVQLNLNQFLNEKLSKSKLCRLNYKTSNWFCQIYFNKPNFHNDIWPFLQSLNTNRR